MDKTQFCLECREPLGDDMTVRVFEHGRGSSVDVRQTKYLLHLECHQERGGNGYSSAELGEAIAELNGE